jgi:hypothetical protein
MSFTPLAAAFLVGEVSCHAAQVKFPTVCSAFDRHGDAATVNFSERKLVISISPAGGGQPTAKSASVNEEGVIGCSVHFSADDHYMAVGLSHLGLRSGPLHVIVVDTTTSSVTGNFEVRSTSGTGQSIDLVGFLRGDPTLVVMGTGARDQPSSNFSITLFSVTGEQEASPVAHVAPEHTAINWDPRHADAKHNRFWFTSRPESCPFRFISLAGKESGNVNVDNPDARAACYVSRVIAYPGENSIIAAVTRQPSDLVTTIYLTQNGAQQISLPHPRGLGSYTSVDEGSLSPDGEYFAISRNVLYNAFFSGRGFSRGTEVDVVQVSPLKFVGAFHFKQTLASESISIDHRDGFVAALFFDFKSSRWGSERLKVQ